MTKLPAKRSSTIMLRLDDADHASFEAMATATGVPAATLAFSAAQALLRAYQENGFVTLPLRMQLVPEWEQRRAEQRHMLNEPPAVEKRA